MSKDDQGQAAVAELSLSDQGSKVLAEVKKLADEDRQALVLEMVKGETVLWLSQFVQKAQDALGVSPMAMAAPAAAGGGGEAAEKAEEKTEFKVLLKAVGDQKIAVVKVVRQITSLPLREAKELVDKAPGTLKEAAPKDEAEKIKKELEAVGATVELA